MTSSSIWSSRRVTRTGPHRRRRDAARGSGRRAARGRRRRRRPSRRRTAHQLLVTTVMKVFTVGPLERVDVPDHRVVDRVAAVGLEHSELDWVAELPPRGAASHAPLRDRRRRSRVDGVLLWPVDVGERPVTGASHVLDVGREPRRDRPHGGRERARLGRARDVAADPGRAGAPARGAFDGRLQRHRRRQWGGAAAAGPPGRRAAAAGSRAPGDRVKGARPAPGTAS
jgi:hypothetical protein